MAKARPKAKESRARFRDRTVPATVLSAKHLAAAFEKACASKQRVALRKSGRTVAAVVPAEDLATLERLDDLADAETCRAALADRERDGRRTVTLEKIIEKFGIRP